MRISFLACIYCLFAVSGPLRGQVQPQPSTQQINIDWADLLESIQNDPRGQVQRLVGNVELSQDSIYMYADSADLIEETQLYAYDNVIIQQGDSLAAFAERLTYDAEERIARLRREVVLQNGSVELFTAALDYNLQTKVAVYNTPGRLTNGQTELRSERGRYYVDEELVFFRDSVVVIDDRFEMRADSLRYRVDEEKVYFTGPTVIRADSSEIYCEAGYYDLVNEQAEFRENAQFRQGEQLAVADTIRYQGAGKEIYDLIGDAYFQEGEQRRAQGDRIRYYRLRDEYELEGDALVIDGNREVRGDTIVYEAATGAYSVSGNRPRIVDGNTILEAEEVNYDDELGVGIATGQVIWRDTSAQLTIESARAEYDDATGYLKAIGGHPGREDRPVLITELDGDSLWLAADTLVAYREVNGQVIGRNDAAAEEVQPDSLLTISTDSIYADTLIEQADSSMIVMVDSTGGSLSPANTPEPDTSRTVLAYRRVRVYKSDLQAVGDSLSFSTSDSILTLYDDPVMWQDTSQLLADTIDVYLRNQTVDKVHLKRQALVVTSLDLIFFNQIKGRNIFAYFVEQELQRTEVDGNAEAIYYPVDSDDAYLGMNETACSRMTFFFRGGGIRRFTCLGQPAGQLVPLPIPTVQPELEGFKWVEERRPLSENDIF